MPIPPFGAAPTPDATTTNKGKVQLAGDLAGTAASPALATIGAGGTVGDATHIPTITYDTKGRVTSASQVPLTSGSGVPLVVANGITYNVPDNTQVPYGTQIYIQAGGQITLTGSGTLQWVT